MDSFQLIIDPDKFRSTNSMWNELMLNDPWSVGYVSTLIELQDWKCKEEWENFYYKSGQKRRTLLGANVALLDDYTLIRNHKSDIYRLSWELKNINYQYGRTPSDLMIKAQDLYSHIKNNGFGLSVDECFECVRYRTICETWNGIILRERNTIETLQQIFPTLIISKTDGEIDHNFAVDYELYKSSNLMCGIQIKPKTYLSNTPYLQRAKYANARKYAEYKNTFGVPVFTIISSTKGEIYNSDILSQIRAML